MNLVYTPQFVRRKAVWGPKRTLAAALALALGVAVSASAAPGQAKGKPGTPNGYARAYKLDNELTFRSSHKPTGTTRVIVELRPGAQLPPEFKKFASAKGKLGIVNGQVMDLPNVVLKQIAAHPSVFRVHYDRPIRKHNYRTSLTVGTRAVQQTLGLTGAGVGVAVIDSGITNWHDDLTNRSSAVYPYGNQRVAAFVDFVNGQLTPYDDDGHGTHVAGIIAGNGFDSNGQKAGAAPDASLVSLKVLDAQGGGTISNVIAALDWVLANHTQYNIRVVNLSVGAQITESYWTDPLTLAAKRVVDAGVVVVTAAGNNGKNLAGQPQYGGIGSPGNAPWVLTVGASSTNGTPTRTDDTMASFSSRGPTFLDWAAKPDLVAPGVGSVSLADPISRYYAEKAAFLQAGSIATSFTPYLTLSGTSMAAPVVSGTVALMLQANPALTPNAVKAILQYTAQAYPGYDALTQGAGFLNAVGAVRLARFFATAKPGDTYPLQDIWSRKIVWGNHELSNGFIDPTASAFAAGTTWGAAQSAAGDNIVWGTACGAACDNIVWGTVGGDDNIVWGTAMVGDNIVWGTAGGDDNIVWGTDCGGADCDNIVWGTVSADNIVWGTAMIGDNIVWGTAAVDNIVWGTASIDNIVWGTDGSDNIVWGTDGSDNIVWGTDGGDNIVWGTVAQDNIVWGTTDADNIVWGTDGDNIVWGTTDGDNIVWGTAGSLSVVWVVSPNGSASVLSGPAVFDALTDRRILALIETVAPALPSPVLAIVTADTIPTDTTTTVAEPVVVDSTITVDATVTGTTDVSVTTATPVTTTIDSSTTTTVADPSATTTTISGGLF